MNPFYLKSRRRKSGADRKLQPAVEWLDVISGKRGGPAAEARGNGTMTNSGEYPKF
jgi:hypothetical protein